MRRQFHPRHLVQCLLFVLIFTCKSDFSVVFTFHVGVGIFVLIFIFISPWMFQKKKRHVIGHFESKDSENYKTFARMASFLRDDCSFHAAFGSVAIGLVLVEHTHTHTHAHVPTQ